MKKATTIDEQIELYENRNCELDIDEKEIKQILMDVGYFRLGFYSFPFEETYPKKENRTHIYKTGTKFSDIVSLYKFDFALKMALIKYLFLIEINFRAKLIYFASNYFTDKTWFVNPKIMTDKYIRNFPEKVYKSIKENSIVVKQHHKKHPTDIYAPAWKTLEYATFGNIVTTYEALLDKNLKTTISNEYKIRNESIMLNYIRAVKDVRNVVAHGRVLFDYNLEDSLKNGPALAITDKNKNKLFSVILVMKYLLESISSELPNDMEKEIRQVFGSLDSNKTLKDIAINCSGYL